MRGSCQMSCHTCPQLDLLSSRLSMLQDWNAHRLLELRDIQGVLSND